ncbi:hypothetical protein SEA_TYKE_227 [Mycobacterium phage Tyke]|uniref:Uncharacterized protein n=4 Tax=Bixzunavirus TaxID=680114 RepID=A0A3G3BZE9_9CAUD|nr:hypothetical protein KHO60_gp120 [Mycobacterium phage CharlieB]AVI04796.1 hypothetical protein SEA_LIFESAVOR_228 [Mycobacterium phage LifeSavor]AVR77966.1 hypothetical protein SEA_TYKE_227 [Mycobacterium phage Tyke]AYP69614.1 hypothetical protein SEA_CHARLIEB_222 [Mycobacterium phage CharlieB]
MVTFKSGEMGKSCLHNEGTVPMVNSTPRINPEEILSPTFLPQTSVQEFFAYVGGHPLNGRLCDSKAGDMDSEASVLLNADPLRSKTPQHFASQLREQALQRRLDKARTPIARLRARLQQRIHDRLIGWILFD